MLKLKVSGTRNDLKSFRKWLARAVTILPKYQISDDPVFKQNGKEGKYFRYEADLLRPLDMVLMQYNPLFLTGTIIVN